MLYKCVAVVAIAAVHIATASGCGWADEKCCDLVEGRPNEGTCFDKRTVCWETLCMKCGINGKKGCDCAPPPIMALPLAALQGLCCLHPEVNSRKNSSPVFVLSLNLKRMGPCERGPDMQRSPSARTGSF